MFLPQLLRRLAIWFLLLDVLTHDLLPGFVKIRLAILFEQRVRAQRNNNLRSTGPVRIIDAQANALFFQRGVYLCVKFLRKVAAITAVIGVIISHKSCDNIGSFLGIFIAHLKIARNNMAQIAHMIDARCRA